MLILPNDWTSLAAGSVARSMLLLADAVGEYRTASRLLARACVELFLATRHSGEGGLLNVCFEECVIRINDHAWIVADRAEDALLEQVARLRKVVRKVHVLAPPWSAVFIRRAVSAEWAESVQVEGMDTYVDNRVIFSMADCNCDFVEVLLDLFSRYSRLCTAQGAPHLALANIGRIRATPRLGQR